MSMFVTRTALVTIHTRAEAAASEEKVEAENEATEALSKTSGRLGALLAAFSLVFVELGDKNMIATVALARCCASRVLVTCENSFRTGPARHSTATHDKGHS